jgi:CubicO group peptidase (beta-lactamase class C family)
MTKLSTISLFIVAVSCCVSARVAANESGAAWSARCDAAADYSNARRGTSLLVMEDGKAVCEIPATTGPQELWSGTKSIVGLAAAIAAQEGLLVFDEPVARTLPEWTSDPRKSHITIRQLLGMTSGIPSIIGRPPAYADSLIIPANAEPGARFQYGPAPLQIFGELLRRKLMAKGQDGSIRNFVERRLFAPLGVNDFNWRNGPDGNPLLPQGLALSARDWAKIGQLVLDGGRWQDKIIVAPDRLATLLKGSKAHPAYGITWWLARPSENRDQVTLTFDLTQDKSGAFAGTVAAAGAGGQRLYIIPISRLVIVRQAQLDMAAIAVGAERVAPEQRWSDTAFLRILLGAP